VSDEATWTSHVNRCSVDSSNVVGSCWNALVAVIGYSCESACDNHDHVNDCEICKCLDEEREKVAISNDEVRKMKIIVAININL
jgi:hypothetical protein